MEQMNELSSLFHTEMQPLQPSLVESHSRPTSPFKMAQTLFPLSNVSEKKSKEPYNIASGITVGKIAGGFKSATRERFQVSLKTWLNHGLKLVLQRCTIKLIKAVALSWQFLTVQCWQEPTQAWARKPGCSRLLNTRLALCKPADVSAPHKYRSTPPPCSPEADAAPSWAFSQAANSES